MSPIAGLTNVPHAFIKLGNIRKGEMRETKNKSGQVVSRPVDLDYFRITYAPSPQADEVARIIQATYGEKPTELNVRFAEHEPEQVWDAWLECYKQGGLIAQAGSNERGMFWQFYRDPDSSEVLVRNGSAVGEAGAAFISLPIEPTKPIYLNSKGEGIFLEPVGRLQVVIPETASVAVGYFVFQPGSPRDIRNISAELGAYHAMARTYGKSITGIPFILRRRQEEVTKNINGKLSKGPSWVVHLDAGGDWGTKAISMIERLALPDVVEAEVREIETEQAEGDPFSYPPETPEPIIEEPAPQLPPPAKNGKKPLPRTEEQATNIDPTGVEAVKWAALQWNCTNQDAAKAIYDGIKSGKFTNPMVKSAFKDAVKGWKP